MSREEDARNRMRGIPGGMANVELPDPVYAQQRAPIQIDVPVAPWGDVPLSIGLTSLKAIGQDANGNTQPANFVELHFVMPHGIAYGVPLPTGMARTIAEQIIIRCRELDTDIVVPKGVNFDGHSN